MDQQIGGVAAGRRGVRRLRALGGVQAPPSLLPGVLQRVGLADAYVTLQSPLGAVFVAFSHIGISAVSHMTDPTFFEQAFVQRYGRRVYPSREVPGWLDRATQVLNGQAQGAMRVDWRGLSEFEQAVLAKALEIPRGEVRPYSWIAREIGRPAAVRAVGTALAHNPIPLFVPCHRVVRADGRIGQYSLGGRAAKQTILSAEGVDPDELERLAVAGVRFVGSDATRVYCFPTCHHARRIAARHRVAFRSGGEAATSGYRPCRACRPAAVG